MCLGLKLCNFSLQGRCSCLLILGVTLLYPFPISTIASLRCSDHCALGKGGPRLSLAFVCQHFWRPLLPSITSLIPAQFHCHRSHVKSVKEGGAETGLWRRRARECGMIRKTHWILCFVCSRDPAIQIWGKKEVGVTDLSNPPSVLSTSNDDRLSCVTPEHLSFACICCLHGGIPTRMELSFWPWSQLEF